MSHHIGGLAQAFNGITGIRYSPDAAQDARARILAFFDRHLRPGTP